MKKTGLLLLVGMFISTFITAQCDFTFNPSGNVYDPGDPVAITICFQDYSLGFPQYEKADWDLANDGTWDITVTGHDGTAPAIVALGSGTTKDDTYCVKVSFTAGAAGDKISITADATGNTNGCAASQTQQYVLIPIVLESFDVTLKNSVAELNWVTLSEANNDFFTVEMSIDGKEFQPIGDLKGAGNSRDRVEYNFAYFLDEASKSLPFVYFRLKQTDFDGISTESDVIILSNQKINDKTFFSISNVNSSNYSIEFDITTMSDDETKAKISDLNGHTFVNESLTLNKGFNSIRLPIKNAKAGIYILQVMTNQKMITKKIFID